VAFAALAIPCRTDEPALGRTLAAAWRSWEAAAVPRLEVLVCLNGRAGGRPLDDLRAFARAARAPLHEVDVDRDPGAARPAVEGPVEVVVLRTGREGKPNAWNVLRRSVRAPLALFMDADVDLGPDAVGRLLHALLAHPDAVLASAKSVCVARRGVFERIMAAPYRVDFPNLSPQLYAARVARLPTAVPEDLFDQEHWLELLVGRASIVRVPEVGVAVRLPGTLADFFRQRVRIEMGKVQLAREYPDLAARAGPRPSLGSVLGSVGAGGAVTLGAYLMLRSVAHARAWWRYRRGDRDGVWPQAATTKRWDAT
jgi:hypothetical protein